MHDPLIELATVPATPLHPAVVAAREPLTRAIVDLRAIGYASLEVPWRWRPSDPDDLDVRHGFYRIHERLREAVSAIVTGRTNASSAAIGPAVPALGAMAAARWAVHGVLVPLPESAWDGDPGGGEWTVRRTVGHIIGGQRSYGWYNAWYLSQGAIVGDAVYPPDGTMPPEPSEEDDGDGAPDAVLGRLDGVVDASISANAALDRAAMTVGARWSGLPVAIDFRLGRYGSHIREHTIQIDKTLDLLGRRPSEVERLVRLILETYGQLEAEFAGRGAEALEQPLAGGPSAVAILSAAVEDVAATARDVRAAAGA